MVEIGRINPAWKDMSKFVVHFTRESSDNSAFLNSLAILYARNIEARTAFGAGRKLPPARKSVCFSEAPLHELARIAKGRGMHGIGFRKEFLVERGGGPILYAYKDTDHAKAIDRMVREAVDEPDHPVWSIAPFVDLPGTYGNSKYLFEWEREWRVVGDLEFDTEDPAFLIIPEAEHDAARGFFDDAEADDIGPNYKCKFIDPFWDEDKIRETLKG